MLYKWQNYLNFPSLMWLGGGRVSITYIQKSTKLSIYHQMNFYKLNTSFRSAPRSRHRTLLGSQNSCAHSVTGTFFPVQISHLGLGPIRTHGHLICETEGWVWKRTWAFWLFLFFFFNILELPSFVMTQSLIFREAETLPWMPTEPADVLSFALSGWGCNQVSSFPVYAGHSTDEHWPDQECSPLCAVINTEDDSKEQRRNLDIYIKLCYRKRHIIQSPHHL